MITQPCPVIADYIQRFEHSLLKYLSPVHSPMLCAAIYMKQYEGVNDNIAALSPCVAKSREFDAAGHIKYNVTLRKLYKYIRDDNIQLPDEESGFDHAESAYGRLYSMPGRAEREYSILLRQRIAGRLGQRPGYSIPRAESIRQRKRTAPARDIRRVELCGRLQYRNRHRS